MATFSNETDSEDELPFGWIENVDYNGRVYFYNEQNKVTQWIHPKSGKQRHVPLDLPYGWEKIVENNGEVAFFDKINKRKVKTDPRLAFSYEVKDNPHDIRQRFDSSSTCYDVILGNDLSNKVAIVTGANCGIGLECTRALAFCGAKVVMACRDLDKAEVALKSVLKDRPYAKVSCYKCNLASFQSIRSFVEQFLKDNKNGPDILMCNAAIFAVPYSNTEDGYESIFQINYLSHFYLIKLFLPLMEQNVNCRIVLVSSESHRFSFLNIKNISPTYLSPISDRDFFSFMAYDNSKLCLNLLCKALSKRYPNIIVNSCHPGNMVSSNLSRNWWLYRILFALVRPFTKSLDQAAATPVFCATAQELEGVSGFYFNNCVICSESKWAQDEELSEKLWAISEKMIEDNLKTNPAVKP